MYQRCVHAGLEPDKQATWPVAPEILIVAGKNNGADRSKGI